ncbi:MAG: beta-1,6-N-acetylglucosaminyltransferase, partial [Acidobacteriota bacterium]|nr:beta-1,6-N-acetylglucosaminyltransferase [Acidobacteriota bacterium]
MNEKICFLIMAHDRFDQLTRLLRALQHPGFDLYVHVDAKAGPVPVDPALAMVLEQPEVVNWGGYSMVTASLKLLQTAVAGGTPYRYFLLISGTDYPIRGNDEIYRFLCASENQYMHSFSNEDPFWHNRYRKFHFMDMHPWPRRLIHMVGFRIQGRLFPYRKLPLPLTVHFGSGWWTLTHDAVRYILRFVNENPAYAEFFRYSHAADEMFFQTIL